MIRLTKEEFNKIPIYERDDRFFGYLPNGDGGFDVYGHHEATEYADALSNLNPHNLNRDINPYIINKEQKALIDSFCDGKISSNDENAMESIIGAIKILMKLERNNFICQ